MWYTRGSGHNAPVFGEAEQQAGANYTATFLRAEKNILSLDLSKAYPEDAGVVSFVRILNFIKVGDELVTNNSRVKMVIEELNDGTKNPLDRVRIPHRLRAV